MFDSAHFIHPASETAPGHPDANHLLGMIERQAGRSEQAVERGRFQEFPIYYAPPTEGQGTDGEADAELQRVVEEALRKGAQLYQKGLLAEAETLYRKILETNLPSPART